MKKTFAVVIAMFSMLLVMSSCSKVPQAEIDAANAAIEMARTAGADVYLPAEFAALQDSMNAVNALVETKKGKMFGGFGDVKTKLAEITQMAQTVATNTETRKVEVQAELEAAQAEVVTLVTEAKELLAKAPKGKEGKAAVEAIGSEIATVEASMTEVAPLIEQTQFMAALDKLNAAKEKLNSIKTELQAVIEKTGK